MGEERIHSVALTLAHLNQPGHIFILKMLAAEGKTTLRLAGMDNYYDNGGDGGGGMVGIPAAFNAKQIVGNLRVGGTRVSLAVSCCLRCLEVNHRATTTPPGIQRWQHFISSFFVFPSYSVSVCLSVYVCVFLSLSLSLFPPPPFCLSLFVSLFLSSSLSPSVSLSLWLSTPLEDLCRCQGPLHYSTDSLSVVYTHT